MCLIIEEIDDASGDAHDWMQLRNPTDSELNLKGWALELVTPELDTERRLIFNRDVKIPAGGVLLVPYSESLEKNWVSPGKKVRNFSRRTEDDAQMMDRKRNMKIAVK